MDREVISGVSFTEERPLFGARHLEVKDCSFDVGESPLKEASDIKMHGGVFRWKYPLWYTKNIEVNDVTFEQGARAGVWYGENLKFKGCHIDAPKEFRKCKGLTLSDMAIPNAQETLWWCEDVTIDKVSANGDYFAMGSRDLTVRDLTLTGNYSFDGCRNLVIEHSRLISKDCIWNCENVEIRDSVIEGEYLAWNSKHVTLIGCEIKSLQGLCYVEDLKLIDCKLAGSSLCFEYSTVDAVITDRVESVMNPSAGKIKVPVIEKLILDPSMIDPKQTVIEAEIKERLDAFDGIIPAE